MNHATVAIETYPGDAPRLAADRRLFALLWLFALALLFYRLGGPGLFEPDEGRNAEKAREILVLKDWVIPHENFVPVLDKPVFFYWLIAAAYGWFGVSEWVSRLPSAAAAAGCLALVYRFACKQWGFAAAVWSVTVLATSLEFFILARVVIFDMTLTFFVTAALFCFYEALHGPAAPRRLSLLSMYACLGAGTLVKGPIAVLIPAMVGVSYLLATKQWAKLGSLRLPLGAAIVLAIALPWYLAAEFRSPGYLRYFFWEENVARFLTPEFDRSRPWYFFVGVLAVGFSPWVFWLPLAGPSLRRQPRDDAGLFLLSWAGAPFVFFSLSSAKLPHYILPIFPALALLTGKAAAEAAREGRERRWIFHLPWIFQAVTVAYLIAGWFVPEILPVYFRHGMDRLICWFAGWAAALAALYFLFLRSTGLPAAKRPLRVWGCYAASAGLCLIVGVQIMAVVSTTRSAKPVAAEAARWLESGRQPVLYDTYLAGLSYYLRRERPVWIVTHERKTRTILGNFYALEERARPTTRYGDALLDFDEFKKIWEESARPLLVIVKEKNLQRMRQQLGPGGEVRGRVDEYVLLTRR
ncbi:MAG TPA: glycosyltransferase family 39 protein [candidate division Zixibacteria bacterium]|nr:glycosyltransferase family 39 protein [candidate division Zixibacteria bacterium]